MVDMSYAITEDREIRSFILGISVCLDIYWKYLWPDFPSYRFVHNAIKIMLVILFRLYIQKIDPSFCRCVRIFKAKGDSSTEAPRSYLTISSWVFILLIVLILLIEQILHVPIVFLTFIFYCLYALLYSQQKYLICWLICYVPR
jgi:hypothetical protein